jgi:hypothetical protein
VLNARVQVDALGVHLLDFVVLRGTVAPALLRQAVDQDRTAEVPGVGQGALQRLDVVPVDRPDVLEAEVLEHALRQQQVAGGALDRVQRGVQLPADQRSARQGRLDVSQCALVGGAGAQRCHAQGHPASGRRVAAPIVVQHDDDRPLPRRGDVVQRLPGHPTGERSVTDDDDRRPMPLTALLERLGQAVAVAQRGRGVRVLDPVVLGFDAARVTGQPVAGAEGVEPVCSTGDDLVHISLVAGVEQERILRGVEHPVQHQRQLDDAEVGPEVPAALGNLVHQKDPDLVCEVGEFRVGEPPEVRRRQPCRKRSDGRRHDNEPTVPATLPAHPARHGLGGCSPGPA